VSCKAGIVTTITGLKDHTGSSFIAIKKLMQAILPPNKKWLNAMFLGALKKMVADGILVNVKDSYKISADYKKKASKPKNAPK
jgi:histone H1/5